MEFSNIWFYTLSTISQTLASLAGLFAVFVVWKIQSFDNLFSEIKFAIIKIIGDISSNIIDYEAVTQEELHSMSDNEILSKFSEILSIKLNKSERITSSMSVQSDNMVNYSLDKFTEELFKRQVEKKDKIFKKLKKILIYNFLFIGLVVFCLVFSSFICFKEFILFLIFIGFIYCLYLIADSVYKITKE